MSDKLRIIPLGGLNEIGKNMTVLEYGRDMIVVDCGLGFPEDDMYGVDFVIPDVTYLVNNQKKLRGFFITHGHVYHKENLPPVKAGDILLHGHTHVPACEAAGACMVLNPGSVSIPKNGTPRSYMILDGETFTWKTLDGEVFNRYSAEGT